MDYKDGQFTKEHLRLSTEGFELFNDQLYWECHEVFEDLWKEDRSDNARFVWWAVIQVAASMIHYRDEKLPGAKGLIAKAKEKFRKIEELNVETSLMYEFLDWQELKTLVDAVPEDCKLSDFADLFDFRFKHYMKD